MGTGVRRRASPWPFVALGGMAFALFLYGVAFRFVPWWAGLLLLVAWAVMLTVVVRWFVDRPRATLAVPVVALGLWYAVIVGGAATFGWS